MGGGASQVQHPAPVLRADVTMPLAAGRWLRGSRVSFQTAAQSRLRTSQRGERPRLGFVSKEGIPPRTSVSSGPFLRFTQQAHSGASFPELTN